MSKNIVIQEGGTGRQLSVDKLKTNLVGGGTCQWVPEDEVRLTTLHVSENGTYSASDDGYYGYSEVNVSGVGTVVGKDPDGSGDEAAASVDPETGEIKIEKIPSSIRVITPPTNPYGIYQNGQAVVTDGMVVKAYLKSGGEYGVVPNEEITLNPTVAVYDPDTDINEGTATYDEKTVTFAKGTITGSIDKETETAYTTTTYRFYADSSAYIVNRLITAGWQLCLFSLDADVESYTDIYTISTNKKTGEITETTLKSNTYIAELHYIDKNGAQQTFYYGACPYLGFGHLPPTFYEIDEIAQILFDGEISGGTQGGSHQDIEVSWPRPQGGKVLKTSFEIRVAPPIYGGGQAGETGAGRNE